MRVGHVSSLGVIFMQHWSKVDEHVGEPCPVRRSSHAAVCLHYGGDSPQFLVIGGRGGDGGVLSDVWVLDVQSGRWREVSVQLLVCWYAILSQRGH